MKKVLAVFSFVVVAILFVYQAFAQEIPKLSGRVTDATKTLSVKQINELAEISKKIENSFGHRPEVIVLVMNGAEGSIQETAQKFFTTNKLGKKETNNGLLMTVFLDSKRSRIDVGYGLEPYIVDSKAGEIVDLINVQLQSGNLVAAIKTFYQESRNLIPTSLSGEKEKSNGYSLLTLLFVAIGVLVLVGFLVSVLQPNHSSGRYSSRSNRESTRSNDSGSDFALGALLGSLSSSSSSSSSFSDDYSDDYSGGGGDSGGGGGD